jgi:ornithine cyclodeaminase/alanine dehydrogenase-like protein (mu-crystallin family)
VNGNFPANTDLPTIQGVLTLHDSTNGRVLAIMDSMEITTRRTAAASAVAAKYLARADATSMIIIGFGNQGKSHLEAFSHIRDVTTYDVNEQPDAMPQADIIITCTPSREPILYKRDVQPGTFVAAVGTDSETKQEIAPDLLASAKVVADVLTQCRSIGDLHHAPDVAAHAELHEIIRGLTPGRTSPEEITVFDSTGTAIEDAAAASVVYTRAMERGIGMKVDLGA